MTNIHPSAIIENGATIAKSAKIGAFCVISSKAKIGENVVLMERVSIMNDTTIGEGTIVFPGAVLGGGPQDHGNEFKDGMRVVIGKNNIIRENVTIQCGTPKEQMVTTVGDDCMFMVNSHIAHDCVVGNGVIMTNNAVIAGHVRLGDNVILGGNSAVHQFVRIGRGAMIGGMSGSERDVIPFGMVFGLREGIGSLNLIRLKRMGLDKKQVAEVMGLFNLLFKEEEKGSFAERVEIANNLKTDNEIVKEILAFIKDSEQGRRRVLTASRNV